MLEKLQELARNLEAEKIPYSLIGGMAVLLYGGRSSTLDFDLYLLIDDWQAVPDRLAKHFESLLPAGADQWKGRFHGIAVDLLRADPWIGKAVIKRARKKNLAGVRMRVARPEDIIILKTLADRPVDRRDIEELKEIFGATLDKKLIRNELARVRRLLK